MRESLEYWLSQRLDDRQQQGRYRQRRRHPLSGVETRHAMPLDFVSNDYLGLSSDPRVVQALTKGGHRYGAGATASPLLGGYFDVHQRLEEKLAAWLKRPAALLFPSGFQANLGVLDALSGRSARCFHDRLNHASLLDGTRLSGARLERYRHLDMNHLEAKLQSVPKDTQCLVVSDAVFSMDGDIAPLGTLSALCGRHEAWLVIDDAHGVGVLGNEGAGAIAEAGLSVDEAPIVIGTLSKALGVQGAFVAGSEALIESLVQFARPYVYSTGLSPALAAAAEQALSICIEEPHLREYLHSHITCFREMAAAHGLTLLPSRTPIQALVLGDENTTMALSQALQRDRIEVGAIRPPTVAANSSRLRITLNARHTQADIEHLVKRIAHHLQFNTYPQVPA